MKSGGGRGDASRVIGINCLVTVRVLQRYTDVRWQGNLADVIKGFFIGEPYSLHPVVTGLDYFRRYFG